MLFEEVEVLLCYSGVTCVWHHAESSYLTVMDLHYTSIKNKMHLKFRVSGLG